MTKKQKALNQKRYVEKMNEKGYYNLQAWVKRDHKKEVDDYLDWLERRTDDPPDFFDIAG